MDDPLTVVGRPDNATERLDKYAAEAPAGAALHKAAAVLRADVAELALLLLLVFGGLSSEQAIGILMPLAASAAGASYAWIGVLAGAKNLVLVLLLLPGTWLVASWGRRAAVVAGAALQGGAALVSAITPDVHWMLLPQIMLGVGLSLFWPAYLSYFAEVAGAALVRMQMFRSIVQGVALLVTPLIGTYIAGRLGYGSGFAVIGAMTVTAAIIGLRLKGSAGRPGKSAVSPTALFGTYRAAGGLFRRQAFVLILTLSVISTLLIYLVSATFLTLHLKQLGFASVAIGMLVSVRSLSDVTLRTTFTWLAMRIRPLYLMAFAGLGVALVNLVLPACTTPAAIVALMLILGMFASQYDPSSMTVLANLLKSDERDVGVAVWITTNSLAAWSAGPLLGGLGDVKGLSTVFVVSGAVVIVAISTLMLWGRRAARRRDASDELVEMYG